MFRVLMLSLGLALALPIGARAQAEPGPEARVIVPDLPEGAVVNGCYRADRKLYGPYTLSFCLTKRGTYRVRGDDGIRCDGRLNWRTKGRDVVVDLKRQSCNKGVAWAAGRIECLPRNLVDIILDELIDERKQGSAKVIVPDSPRVKWLRCVYKPTVEGERNRTFNARRIEG
jgi:hypothetical protein